MPNLSVVIPARLASTRLPNKVLLPIGGRPMLQCVWEQVRQMRSVAQQFITTDSAMIAEAARGWGADVVMTDPECPSGTDRIASILDQLTGDLILNVQGDEPFIPAELLDHLVEAYVPETYDVVTPVFELKDTAAIQDPNQVKAVRASSGRALYFSRAAVPHLVQGGPGDWVAEGIHWGHIGVYGYSREALSHYPKLISGPLEKAEKLEQLRFLENGLSIQTVVTEYHPIGVDTQADLERARVLMRESYSTSH